MADNRKINHEKGMFDAAAQAFPFLKTMWHMVCIIWDKDGLMNKRRAIQIMANAAGLYKENLEDQRILFLYGTPSEIKKELRMESGKPLSMKKYEAVFHRYNFLHLTGVKINRTEIASAIHFYEKCLGHRLMESDFRFARDGSTNQKLEILENMMCLKRNVTMIGGFSDRGWKLFHRLVVYAMIYSDDRVVFTSRNDAEAGKSTGCNRYLYFSDKPARIIRNPIINHSNFFRKSRYF